MNNLNDKKIFILNFRIFCMIAILLIFISLTACQNKKIDINYDENLIKNTIPDMIMYIIKNSEDENTVNIIKEMEKEEIDAFFKQAQIPLSAGAFLQGIDGYSMLIDEVGNFEKIDDIIINANKDEIKVTSTCVFEKRKVDINFIFNKKGIIKTISFSPKYTLGEISKKAFINTIIGMGTVVVILVFIAFVISLFKFLPKGKYGFKSKKLSENIEDQKIVKDIKAYNNTKLSSNDNLIDDKALVAIITAAICAYENLDNNSSFVVQKIVRREYNNW